MMNKDSKGITLIALIITIIVLLILAGITINAITGNESAMEKAQEAAQKTKEAEQEEQIRLEAVSSKLEPEWDGTVAESFARGTGAEGDPYIIENGAQLAYLASCVNAGETFENKIVSIVKSINLGNKEFTPIGYGGNPATDSNVAVYTSGRIFQGTLDGNNNVITGLKINNEDMQRRQGVGFVGVLGEYGTIKNLIIYEGNIKGAAMVGGIVGASRGETNNCVNSAEISTVSLVGDSGDVAGGIVGFTDSACKIINCKNNGKVTVGERDGGGILGWQEKSGDLEIINCSNTGTIISYTNRVGGIVGSIRGGNIINCYNTGTIIANRQQGGGIAGGFYAGSITNCYNTGNIEAKSDGGRGISGGIVGAITNGTISNVYNSGTVKVGNYTANMEDNTKNVDIVGGIVGVQQNGSISNAYNKGELIKAQDETTMQSGEVLDSLGGVVGQKIGGNVDKTFYYTTDSNLAGIGGLNASQTGTKKVTTDINSLKEFLRKINSL